MKFLFVVQGEGRGHMTQAIALHQILTRQGHEICAVMVGRSRSRMIPEFLVKRIAAPISSFWSPNFKVDAKRRGVSVIGTATDNLIRLPAFARSIVALRRAVRLYEPDVIVNLFEPLTAIYRTLWRPKPKMVCIAHQYLMLHPGFVFPAELRIARWALLAYIRLTSWGADMRLALSFRAMPDFPKRKLTVTPPLMRAEVKTLKATTQDFILAYVLNDGYADELAASHRSCPDIKVLGFWDRQGVPETFQLQENMTFQQLDDIAFLDAMSRCRGLISTAGFESICEAMYLGKPVYMVPVKNQIEQHCNAIDACQAGAGQWGFEFDVTRLQECIEVHPGESEEFRRWADSAESVFADLLTRVVADDPNSGSRMNS